MAEIIVLHRGEEKSIVERGSRGEMEARAVGFDDAKEPKSSDDTKGESKSKAKGKK